MTITGRAKLELVCEFQINESEARALDALAGYGDDAFIKHFYEHLGKAYMEKHEKGLRLFLQTVRDQLPAIMDRMDDCKRVWSGERIAAYRKEVNPA